MERTLPAPLIIRWRVLIDVAPWIGLAWFAMFIASTTDGIDAAVYYSTSFPPDYSASSVLTLSYQYSPAFAFWLQPFRLLPWEVFHALIVGAEIAALAYMVSPGIALLLIFVRAPLVWEELTYGNLNLVIGALVVLGLTRSWPWAFGILTKVTPGIGLIWHLVRRKWRLLGVAAAITLIVTLPSALLAPGAWAEWIGLLNNNVAPGESRFVAAPLLLRWPLAAGLIAWGALTGRRWTVPIGVAIAVPVNYLSWLMALGAIRLLRPQQDD